MIRYAFFSIFVFGLLDNFRGPYYSQILDQLGVGDGIGALFFALMSGCAALASAMGARWIGRTGAALGLHQSAAFMVLGFWLMAGAGSFPLLLVGSAVFGIGAGLGTFAQNVTITELALEGRRSSLLSGLHAMYGLASMLSPWMAHELLERGLSWRSSFLLASLAPLLLGVSGFWSERIKRWPNPLARVDEASPQMSRLQRRHVWLLATAIALYLMAEISIGTRLVRWLEVDRQFSAAAGSIYLAGFFAALFLGRLFSWWRAPHTLVGLRRSLIAITVMGSVTLLLTLKEWPHFVIVSGLILGPFYPLAIAYLRLRFGASAQVALGTTFGIGSLTVLTMHISLGFLAGQFGQTSAMFLGPIGLVMGAALLVLEARIR